MKIKWKLRMQNKATLIALVTAVIAFIYQALGLAGIVPAISESQIVECAGMLINILAMLGIVTDPTTAGVSDSEQALAYSEPKKSANKKSSRT